MVDASGHTEKMANLFNKLSDSYDEAIGQHGRAVGIDISSGMIEHARRLALHAGLRIVECEVDEVFQPHLPQGLQMPEPSLRPSWCALPILNIATISLGLLASA